MPGKESSYDNSTQFDGTNIARSKPNAHAGIRNAKRRIAVFAAVLIIVLASLATVQANGVVFSALSPDGLLNCSALAEPKKNRDLVVDGKWPEIDPVENQQFTSLQEALDFYGVTEVAAPQWIPDGFVPQIVNVNPNGTWLEFLASYTNGSGQVLAVSYNSYQETPAYVL